MMNEYYAIWDSKAEYYMPPFLERNDMTAIRALRAAMQDEGQLSRHATDYSLFHIGTWDQISGTILCTGPKHVTDAWIIKAQIENEKDTE